MNGSGERGITVTLQEYLNQHQMKLSTFAKIYNLDYHRLFRVKHGTITRDPAIQAIFEQLGIVNELKEIEGEPNSSFISQERICITCERAGEIYCYYTYHLKEIEAYLSRYQIPYYVRKAKDYWIVKYDKEAIE